MAQTTSSLKFAGVFRARSSAAETPLLSSPPGLEANDKQVHGIRVYPHPRLPSKTPQIPSNRDHKALNLGILGVGSG